MPGGAPWICDSTRPIRYDGFDVAKETTESLKGTIKGDTARKDRLAAQLRENLKRRKAKARAQAYEPQADAVGQPARNDSDS